MNPQPTRRKGPELPRARVMFADPTMAVIEKHQISRIVGGNWTFTNLPLAVIPARSLREAREMAKAAKFFQLTEEEQLKAITEVLWCGGNQVVDDANRVLARILKGGKP